MKQLSNVLTISAVVWSACMLPAALAVLQFHKDNWFLFIYGLLGLGLFAGIFVLRIMERWKKPRRQLDDK